MNNETLPQREQTRKVLLDLVNDPGLVIYEPAIVESLRGRPNGSTKKLDRTTRREPSMFERVLGGGWPQNMW